MSPRSIINPSTRDTTMLVNLQFHSDNVEEMKQAEALLVSMIAAAASSTPSAQMELPLEQPAPGPQLAQVEPDPAIRMPQEAPPAAAPPPPAPGPSPVPQAAPPPQLAITFDTLKAEMQALNQRIGDPQVMVDMLHRRGAKKLSELDPSTYADVLAEARRLVPGAH